MNQQHDMPADGTQDGPVNHDSQPAGTPRHVRVTIGKHFNLSVSLSVSPAFLVFLAAAAGVAGGNYWFLL
ncbi:MULTISPECIES: hypothetical protein [Streptomyces]|uniref:Uncharacterized protein n=1 Tax=Streptomyces dengpaensis TaxID=2049881 RepID=A0ABM6SQJ3_9ACTN|nr:MULTISPECIES: hypothetical protein [Streptomyces]AVH56482.1 hypothetical protein C4B68_12640 [Streptomyces dengpaensis]